MNTNEKVEELLTRRLSGLTVYAREGEDKDTLLLNANNGTIYVSATVKSSTISVVVNGCVQKYIFHVFLTPAEFAEKPIEFFVKHSTVRHGVNRFSALDVREYVFDYVITHAKPDVSFEEKKDFVDYFMNDCFDKEIGTTEEFAKNYEILNLTEKLCKICPDANVVELIMDLPKRACVVDYAIRETLKAYTKMGTTSIAE